MGMDELAWRPLEESDHEPVLATLSAWSSGRDFHALLPRLFFAHFSDTSLIVEDAEGNLAGFIVAFVSQTQLRTGYVHFVWVSPQLRRTGLGAAALRAGLRPPSGSRLPAGRGGDDP